jgi:hypothetical protein
MGIKKLETSEDMEREQTKSKYAYHKKRPTKLQSIELNGWQK